MHDIDAAIEIREADLARVQAELDALRTARAVLSRLVPPTVGPEPATPEVQPSGQNGEAPKRRKARPAAEVRQEGKPPGPREKGLLNRLAIARFLAATGGATFGQILHGCPVPRGSIAAVLAQPWFGKGGDGRYTLSNEGRRQLAAHGEKAASATPEGQESDRLRIARLIRTDGPMSVGTLVGKTGLPLSVVHPAVRHEWFAVNGGKYSLTAEGESALRTSTPSDEE